MIYTAGVSYAINCSEKTILIKLWEKDDLAYKTSLKSFIIY